MVSEEEDGKSDERFSREVEGRHRQARKIDKTTGIVKIERGKGSMTIRREARLTTMQSHCSSIRVAQAGWTIERGDIK